MRRNNRRNRKKHANQVDKSELQNNYEEDYNEVILNDLVPEDKKEELGLQESNISKRRKKGISLGLKKKKTTFNKDKDTEKSSKKQNKSINNVEVNPSKTIKSKKKSNNKSKETQEEGNTKKSHYKNKSSKVSEVKEESKENVINNIEDNNIKKTKKNKTHKRRNKSGKKEENVEVKDFSEEVEQIDDLNIEDENYNFRSIESNSEDTLNKIPQVEEVEPKTTKLENIVWSKENFPNK